MLTLGKRNGSFWPKAISDLLGSDNWPEFDNRFYDWDQKFEIPSVNIKETEKEFQIEVAAPGFEKKDFKIESSEGVLTIQAEKEIKKEEDKEEIKRQEFSYASIKRSFSLPENAESDKIEAKYENGILMLEIPKLKQVVAPAKKEIKVG
ncbi:Hsp20/alpha crystallin family protein [Cyclobacterium plantarum]|uniref:Hsp20/alpha crystallin family protein n=1 Tax=Cyclobacterium plantarum TaxID=2716263 RepID=A0ABX0HCV2_9BACT|nr:Hsp20/alpha crystallin family protein [Cyclobacterium plantarum]NHE59721.1 Hsp20/alpha crystallin family protein [Cyclobacterium plantarum]